MNFFQHQENAKKQSRKLLVYFGLSVAGVVGTLYLICVGCLYYFVENGQDRIADEMILPQWWQPGLFSVVAMIVAMIITAGALYKIALLRGGGRGIAQMMRAREILPSTVDAYESQLINVVTEMSIASGVPVPAVFVMDREESINAFAAGYAADEAVVVVSRGCLKLLDRAELQGVVGHEFSHILHGDMCLNIRMMGLIHGLVVIGLIGYWTLRAAGEIADDEDGIKLAIPLAAIGASVWAVGSVGVIFGEMLKSAVCRQREFLADASALQFTRNASGLVNALRKIGGLKERGLLRSRNAEQVSYMCFSSAVKKSWGASLATHPPLGVRILRMDPAWGGDFLVSKPLPDNSVTMRHGGKAPDRDVGVIEELTAEALGLGLVSDVDVPEEKFIATEETLNLMGTVDDHHFLYAQKVLREIPASIKEMADQPFTARAVLACLLMSEVPEVKKKQWALLHDYELSRLAEEVEKILPEVIGLGMAMKLPLIEISLPALRWLSDAQRVSYKALLKGLVDADDDVDLFEYALYHTLMRRLKESTSPKRKFPNVFDVRKVREELAVILSTVAYAGHEEGGATEAFVKGSGQFSNWGLSLSILPMEECHLDAVDQALARLDRVTPQIKESLVRAVGVCIGFDGVVTLEEAELFRAVAEVLHCPVPPLFAAA